MPFVNWLVQVIIPVSAMVIGLVALFGTPTDGEGLVMVQRGFVGGIAVMSIITVLAVMLAVK